jgi:ABC-2 type transport system permease protein
MIDRTPLDPTPMHRLIRHGRIWRRFLVIAVSREAQFRANAFGTIVAGIVQVLVALIPVFLIYERTETINGWTRAEVIALTGLFQIGTGIIETFLQQNMNRITSLVVDGELDGVLLRPMSAQMYVTTRWISLASLSTIAIGVVLMVIGIQRAGFSPSPLDVVVAAAIFAVGIVLVTCFWSCLAYVVFWSTSVQSIAMLFADLWYGASVPVRFYPSVLRVLLTFVLPVAFVTSVPIDVLAGRAGMPELGTALALACGAVVLVRRWWRFALRFYSSASS